MKNNSSETKMENNLLEGDDGIINLRRSSSGSSSSGEGGGSWPIFFMFFGIMLIGLSLPAAWFNEQRQVKICKLIHKGEKAVIPNVDTNILDPNNNYKLIHCIGNMVTNTPCVDESFSIYQQQACYIERKVECFQAREEKIQVDSDHCRYEYHHEWKAERIHSEDFHTQQPVQNPEKWPCESEKFINPHVQLGQYIIQDSQKELLKHSQPIDLNPNLVQTIVQRGYPLCQSVGYGMPVEGPERKFYCRMGGQTWTPGTDNIGDFRISWYVTGIPIEPVTVVAQQIQMPDNTAFTFRQWNPEKIQDEDNEPHESQCCPIACVCCFYVEQHMKEQNKAVVNHIHVGQQDATFVFKDMHKLLDNKVSRIRWITFSANVFGHILFLIPFISAFMWIPMVLFFNGLWIGLSIFAFGVIWGCISHMLVLTAAYIFYRPKFGFAMLLGVCLCIGLLFII